MWLQTSPRSQQALEQEIKNVTDCIQFCISKDSRKFRTIGISNHFGVAEADCDGQTQEHENPVHLRYVDLAVDMA